MIEREPDRTVRDRDRGQTMLDFAVAMGVFLVTVLFVLAYAPTMFDPFAGGSGTKLVVADRAATTLSADVLAASTAEPGVLSASCLIAFFGGGDDKCSTGEYLDSNDIPAVTNRNYNVTIHDLNASVDTPATPLDEPDDIELTKSNSGSVPTDVAVATRTVSIEGDPYRLTVRVW
ncbi:hypothetical protein [Natronomonas sp.]|jgi:hypothetical protein|uniref:DUF7287 family protein n=1 Tax=Natronomonas sp. TaxID=2184060 RepID=UPI003988DFE1